MSKSTVRIKPKPFHFGGGLIIYYRGVFMKFRLSKCHQKISVLKNTESADEYERCIICGDKTPFCINEPIENREFYEIGLGQLCHRCYKKYIKTGK